MGLNFSDIARFSPQAQRQIAEKIKNAAGKSAENKYHAKKTGEFASRKEADRWAELTAMEKAGLISDLRKQVPYKLLDAAVAPSGRRERAIIYIADFVYTKDGKTVVEDVKGFRGGAAYRIFAIKRKLMLSVHKIEVIEI